MDLGRCPRCARPFSASEIAGFGILRPRAERAGGPLMEYRCAGCGHRLRLVPHGDGRYAPPGEPPPPPVPLQERRPPWVAGDARGRRTAAAGAPDAAAPDADREPAPRASPPRPAEPVPPPARDVPPRTFDEDAPVGPAEALALLGCSPSANRSEVERAFRERSRTCHPDKVAHLDPEFQELAERKFKRLRQAYDFLLS